MLNFIKQCFSKEKYEKKDTGIMQFVETEQGLRYIASDGCVIIFNNKVKENKMITSSWICPACGKRETYSDNGDDLWMECRCPNCKCEFAVNVPTTEGN